METVCENRVTGGTTNLVEVRVFNLEDNHISASRNVLFQTL